MVRYMDIPRNGGRTGELAGGFVYGIRPGLKRRDDLLLFSVSLGRGTMNSGSSSSVSGVGDARLSNELLPARMRKSSLHAWARTPLEVRPVSVRKDG